MKRIAIVSSQAFSLENFRGPLIRALVDREVTVYALAPDFTPESREAVIQLGAQPVDYSLSRVGTNPLRDISDMFRLVGVLRPLQVDAVLAYFVKPVIYGTLAAWLARVPRRFALIEGLGYVFTPPSEGESMKRRSLRAAVARLYGLALKRAHRVFFLNQDDVDEFVSGGLVRHKKAVKLGGIGVDLAHWKPARPAVEPITFLLVARLLREKGIADFVQAARLVKAQHSSARFILLGSLDPNPGSLSRAEVESWVAEGVVEWPGHEDVKPWLAQTSVFVLPSYREGVPRSTQEAMAMARPVITTDVPGCRDTVIDGDNGFLVPVRDPAALAAAMFRFIDEPELVESMGRASRRIAEARFDVHRVNRAMLEAMGLGRAVAAGQEGAGASPRRQVAEACGVREGA